MGQKRDPRDGYSGKSPVEFLSELADAPEFLTKVQGLDRTFAIRRMCQEM